MNARTGSAPYDCAGRLSELGEWKQAASVEADLRREFLARAEKAEATVKDLKAALKEMIQTQDDWENGVAKIIGRQPEVFTRAIDRARAALERC